MNSQCELSDVAKRYLCSFYDILDEMIRDMTNAELSQSISRNFILQMIPHHRAAIQMSRNILQYTTFLPVQKIASHIILSQTKSIESMGEVLELCGGAEDSWREQSLYLRKYHQIAHCMFAGMENAPASNNINADFLREMIPHHKGAIRMSENALAFPICRELKPILKSIITSQKAGVREMERLLGCCSR